MIRLARSAVKGESGRLNVGVVAGATFRLLPRTFPRFKKAFPDVEIQLFESTSRKIVEDVIERRIDIGIVRSPLSFPCECDVIQVEDDELVAVLPLTHRLSSRKYIDLKDLKPDPFVMYSYAQAPSLHAVVSFACQQVGFVPRISQEAVQLQTIVSMVRSGFGVALVPSACVDWIGESLAVCRIRDARAYLSVGLAVVTNSQSQTNLVRNFALSLQSEP
jgi:DNA-binding transcriptional LysR family regulator